MSVRLSRRPCVRLQHPDRPDPNLHRGTATRLPQMSAHGSMVMVDPLDHRREVSAALDDGRLLMEVSEDQRLPRAASEGPRSGRRLLGQASLSNDGRPRQRRYPSRFSC